MAQFRVGKNDYTSEKLDAVTQWNVTRRIGPVVAEFAPLVALNIPVEELVGAVMSDTGFSVNFIKNLTREVAKMSDEDTRYVFAHTLSRVHRHELNPSTGDVAAKVPVWNASANQMQYADIHMGHMLQLVWLTLKEDLGPFLQELLSGSTE